MGDEPRSTPSAIDHRQVPDAPRLHRPPGARQQIAWTDRHDVVCHEIGDRRSDASLLVAGRPPDAELTGSFSARAPRRQAIHVGTSVASAVAVIETLPA